MPSGEDYKVKKKNKAIRKKLRSESSKVSNRIAAIIAQKKRRQSGKRRMCQGMCFSLPTLEDPYNDKLMNIDSKKKDKTKKIKKDWPLKGGNKRKDNDDDQSNGEKQERKRARVDKELTMSDKKSSKKVNENVSKDEGCPSKFLIACLKTIQDMMQHNEAFEPGKPLFFDSWGFEFWKCYSSGKHVLETSGSATLEQIAWIGSTAVDTITKKEKEGVSFPSPYLLFVVPSQEKATQVRAVFKPLKVYGIHTVSLHPGASIDHQIHGLKTCEPKFLVCTPDRLLELASMKAIDISGVCSLIIDGLESSSEDAYLDSIKSIQQHISVDPHTVVFCSGLTDAHLPVASSLLPSPMHKLSRVKVSVSKSAIMSRSIDVVPSTEKKSKRMSANRDAKRSLKRQREKRLEDKIVERINETIIDVLPIIIEQVTKVLHNQNSTFSASVQIGEGSQSRISNCEKTRGTSRAVCNQCGKGHPGQVCYKAVGACFRCGSMEHKLKECEFAGKNHEKTSVTPTYLRGLENDENRVTSSSWCDLCDKNHVWSNNKDLPTTD